MVLLRVSKIRCGSRSVRFRNLAICSPQNVIEDQGFPNRMMERNQRWWFASEQDQQSVLEPGISRSEELLNFRKSSKISQSRAIENKAACLSQAPLGFHSSAMTILVPYGGVAPPSGSNLGCCAWDLVCIPVVSLISLTHCAHGLTQSLTDALLSSALDVLLRLAVHFEVTPIDLSAAVGPSLLPMRASQWRATAILECMHLRASCACRSATRETSTVIKASMQSIRKMCGCERADSWNYQIHRHGQRNLSSWRK